MEIWYKTDSGKLMPHNEDSVGWFSLDMGGASGPIKAQLLFVADGIGGRNKGDVASKTVARLLTFRMIRILSSVVDINADYLQDELQMGFHAMNRMLRSEGDKKAELKGMGSTLTTAIILGDTVVVGHAGDSRLYNIKDGTMTQVTKDHSLVQELLDKGEITVEEAFDHPNKNRIHTAIGAKPEMEPSVFTYTWDEGLLLMCTDGLNDMLRDNEMGQIATEHYNDPGAMVEKLVEAALEKGGHDNVSVLVAKK